MHKKHSRIGLLGSLAIHSVLFTGVWYAVTHTTPPKFEEQSTLSLEIMAALLQQPEVATSPEPNNENVEEVTASEPEAIETPAETMADPEPEPVETRTPVEVAPVVKLIEKAKEPPKPKKQEKPKKKEQPKEKPKPALKPKEKLKEPPKEKKAEKPKVSVKAIEKGSEVKQGVVAKTVPNAMKSTKVQEGIVNGSTKSTNVQGNSHRDILGNSNQTHNGNAASSNDIGAYKILLQRTLQQRANNAYPQREKMMKKMGTVTLALSVSPSGQVVNVSIISSSGHSNLDTAAVKAAERTKLNSSPPLGFPPSLTVPVKFSVN